MAREDAGYKPFLSLSQGLRYRRRLGVARHSWQFGSVIPAQFSTVIPVKTGIHPFLAPSVRLERETKARGHCEKTQVANLRYRNTRERAVFPSFLRSSVPSSLPGLVPSFPRNLVPSFP